MRNSFSISLRRKFVGFVFYFLCDVMSTATEILFILSDFYFRTRGTMSLEGFPSSAEKVDFHSIPELSNFLHLQLSDKQTLMRMNFKCKINKKWELVEIWISLKENICKVNFPRTAELEMFFFSFLILSISVPYGSEEKHFWVTAKCFV